MLRSMYAGVSGLRTHQTMMDVVGNNIANVNTAGFKSSATVFQDVLSQTLQGAGGAVDQQGGTNPAQVGLGVQLGAISTNLNQGASQLTGRATDLAVQGDGYFVVQEQGQQMFTRAGSFSLDERGQLVTPSGGLVQGYPAAADGTFPARTAATATAAIALPTTKPGDTATPPAGLQSFTISANGTVMGTFSDGSSQAIAQVALANFANPGGLEKAGGSLLRTTVNSGDPAIGGATDNGTGTLAAGVLEMSNVDLAQEFTNLIVAQRGFQANSRIISASDELLQDLVNLKR